MIRITADTRYKLYVNSIRVAVGPSRGCDKIWYYDTIDIAPFLRHGENVIQVMVLRYFPSVMGGHSFGRTILPGLTVTGKIGEVDLATDEQWVGKVDRGVAFPVGSYYDLFLHVSEALLWEEGFKRLSV